MLKRFVLRADVRVLALLLCGCVPFATAEEVNFAPYLSERLNYALEMPAGMFSTTLTYSMNTTAGPAQVSSQIYRSIEVEHEVKRVEYPADFSVSGTQLLEAELQAIVQDEQRDVVHYQSDYSAEVPRIVVSFVDVESDIQHTLGLFVDGLRVYHLSALARESTPLETANLHAQRMIESFYLPNANAEYDHQFALQKADASAMAQLDPVAHYRASVARSVQDWALSEACASIRTSRESVDLIVHVQASGEIQEAFTQPRVARAKCVETELTGQQLPSPPMYPLRMIFSVLI